MFAKANLNDAKLIFNLRFEKLSTRYSISKKKISYLDHLRWFRKIIKQKKEKIFVFEKNKGYLRVNYLRNKNYYQYPIIEEKSYTNKLIFIPVLLRESVAIISPSRYCNAI